MALIKINTDGGSRGNPGPSAWAYVCTREEDGKTGRLAGRGFLGCTTNNVAEYTALVNALDAMLTYAACGDTIQIYADSKLMVEQVDGRFACTSDHLVPLCTRAQGMIDALRDSGLTVTLKHVRRHLNVEADALVNEVLDEEEIVR